MNNSINNHQANSMKNSSRTESEKKYNINPDRDFDLANAASATDLTGLVPRPPITEGEFEAYGELYEYQPQDITVSEARHN